MASVHKYLSIFFHFYIHNLYIHNLYIDNFNEYKYPITWL